MTAAPATARAALAHAAAEWSAQDPDPVTRSELRELLAAAEAGGRTALAELADAFSGMLEFGTAGLRGALGAGPNRMNRVVVARAAAGLCRFVNERSLNERGLTERRLSERRLNEHSLGENVAQPGRVGTTLVIGYDARHNSAVFARDTAEIAAGAGLRSVLLPRALPTPVLAFAIRFLGADAGVMVTASHNPAADNGYKVYLGDGRQIVPPDDTAIAAAIAAVGDIRTLPRDAAAVVVPDVDAPGAILTEYLRRLNDLLGSAGPGRDRVRLVTTVVHGVGGPVLGAALAAAGFDAVATVAAQQQPDPDFPTTPFPNPEEPGVLDLAVARARAVDADLVLACDPDADRCAVAVPDPRQGWDRGRRLTGDEVGSLLAWRILNDAIPTLGGAGAAARDGARATVAATIVSSTQIDALAAAAGAPMAHTLTGFKWLTRVPGLRFAYEEALGYCVDPATVSDKDGISACLVVADLAARLKAGELPGVGTTITDALERIDAECGVVATGQLSIRVTRLARRGELLAALAATPPVALGGLAVRRIEDLGNGLDGLPPTPGLRLTLADPHGAATGRVVARPSGTEPKLKCYLQVALPPTPDVVAARARASAALAALTEELRDRLGG